MLPNLQNNSTFNVRQPIFRRVYRRDFGGRRTLAVNNVYTPRGGAYEIADFDPFRRKERSELARRVDFVDERGKRKPRVSSHEI